MLSKLIKMYNTLTGYTLLVTQRQVDGRDRGELSYAECRKTIMQNVMTSATSESAPSYVSYVADSTILNILAYNSEKLCQATTWMRSYVDKYTDAAPDSIKSYVCCDHKTELYGEHVKLNSEYM